MAQQPDIRISSVMADMKRPFMVTTNRWEYLNKHIPVWKDYVRYRMYTGLFGVIGVATIFTTPPLGILSLAAAMYYWQVSLRDEARLTSQRTVIIGH